jgi:hypothetical protein
VKANVTGDIWLIGGIVSRLLLEELYQIPQETYDFDFLVENVAEHLSIPDGGLINGKNMVIQRS